MTEIVPTPAPPAASIGGVSVGSGVLTPISAPSHGPFDPAIFDSAIFDVGGSDMSAVSSPPAATLVPIPAP